METLLRAVGALRVIPEEEYEAADRVRRHRNSLVHEGEFADVRSVTIESSKRDLCRYFKRLPLDW
jgi:hypothetical protein